jgi:nicotinate-nucleotide pyrophosphorylase (carboxylating)
MSGFVEDEGSLSRIVEMALREDVGMGDVTSDSLIPESQLGTAVLRGKESGVFSGSDILRTTFRTVDPSLVINQKVFDGDLFDAGEVIAEVSGSVKAILMAERVALNFVQRMSGIATMTRRYVEAVAETGVRIIDTRKTVPGLRLLDKKAVRDGGGENHRFGLDEMVLIKDNHIAAAGGITQAVQQCRAYLTSQKLDLKIEVETETFQDVEECLRCGGVDRIMLDNFEIGEMKRAVERIRHALEVEASGGITLATVRSVAETGVDFISVGALTHSVKALDISLDIIT